MRNIVIVLVLLSFYCAKEEGVTDVEADKSAITNIVNTSVYFNTTEHYEGEAVSDSGDTSGLLNADTLGAVLWGRELHDRKSPVIDIKINGDSAYVYYTGGNIGFLDILTYMPDTGWVLFKKPLSETFTIRAVFQRTGPVTSQNRGWELTYISGAHGISDSVHTVRIDSIRIQSESYPDTLIRDPLALFSVDNILTFKPQEEVNLTLYTNDGTANAFLHIFAYFPPHIRIPFANMGSGMYENPNPWHANLIPSIRLAVFDFMQYETLHDSEYPYDFDGWLFPYIVQE